MGIEGHMTRDMEWSGCEETTTQQLLEDAFINLKNGMWVFTFSMDVGLGTKIIPLQNCSYFWKF